MDRARQACLSTYKGLSTRSDPKVGIVVPELHIVHHPGLCVAPTTTRILLLSAEHQKRDGTKALPTRLRKRTTQLGKTTVPCPWWAHAVLQFATIDPSTDTPRVRSVRHYGFVTQHALLGLTHHVDDRRAHAWTSSTQEQFRVRVRASVVPAPRCSYPYPLLLVVGAGYDWEVERMPSFDETRGRLKASLCWPVSGTPVEGREEEMKRWPRTIEQFPPLLVATANFQGCNRSDLTHNELDVGKENSIQGYR
ncbi:hypothetical protein JVU11DRAFT_4641 [Chiua virens]|nr:hypothetical protein JVU11DRAFT_4641 [Chiua virens]